MLKVLMSVPSNILLLLLYYYSSLNNVFRGSFPVVQLPRRGADHPPHLVLTLYAFVAWTGMPLPFYIR